MNESNMCIEIQEQQQKQDAKSRQSKLPLPLQLTKSPSPAPAPAQSQISPKKKKKKNQHTPLHCDTLYQCTKCHRMLGRHRFPKKILRPIIQMEEENAKANEEKVKENANANTKAHEAEDTIHERKKKGRKNKIENNNNNTNTNNCHDDDDDVPGRRTMMTIEKSTMRDESDNVSSESNNSTNTTTTTHKSRNNNDTSSNETNTSSVLLLRQTIVCHQCRQFEASKRMKQVVPSPKNHNHQQEGRRADSGQYRRPNNFGYCHYLDMVMSLQCFAELIHLQVFRSAKDISESMAAIQAVFKHSTIPRMKSHSSSGTTDRNKESRSSSSGNIGPEQERARDVLCLCIGDGNTPRTAVLLSFLTKGLWDCVSIDPALSTEWSDNDTQGTESETETKAEATEAATVEQHRHHTVRGLYGYKGTLKEFVMDSNRPPTITTTTTAAAATINGTNTTNTRQQQQQKPVWKHLLLLCVHSHARFINEATIEKIRSLYSVSSVLPPLPPLPPSTSLLFCSPTTHADHDDSGKNKNDNENNNNNNNNHNTNAMSSLLHIPTTIVSLPCCPQFRHVRDIGCPPHLKYEDDGVFSACRSVEIWNFP